MGNASDERFVETVTKVLQKNKITVNPTGIRVEKFKALPDTLDDFKAYFIDDDNEVKNMGLFKRRIMGLASYFRSAQESLMPKFSKASNFHVVKIPMSQFQFGVYEEARVSERKLELQNARKKNAQQMAFLVLSPLSIFSRAFCNYVFPRPDIRRPMPTKGEDLKPLFLKRPLMRTHLMRTTQEKLDNVDGRYEVDELAETRKTKVMKCVFRQLWQLLKLKRTDFLPGFETYAPSF